MTAATPDLRARQIAENMLSKDAYSQWLGIRIAAVGRGHATLHMAVREEMCNGFGICHGGIAYSLADSAAAFASNGYGPITVLLNGGMSYPQAIHAGENLTAEAVQESLSGKMGIYKVLLKRQDGEVVAVFQGTVYQTRQFHPEGE
ncbi:MAG TPA: hydroxyphenylacetyl-CoA thioesterase PaaI [Calditrichia bacterium]|nr:hydroxyphenylacetyl-CoA thioesterase PaaI [Calditrichota bacterium]HQV32790.1 hydroxyphenylacetyl-CoA thioesterase PaaI [Calditrichia bacterium]